MNIQDVLNINDLQRLQNYFSNTTGLSAVVLNSLGEVTKPSNFTDFYTKFANIKNEQYQACPTANPMEIQFSTNSVGMLSFSVPIVINENYLGSFFVGQVFEKKYDETLAQKFAYDIDINLEELKTYLDQVPVMPNEKIRHSAEFLAYLVKNLVNSVESFSEINSSYNGIIEQVKQVKDSLSEFYKTSSVLSSSQEELIFEVQNINALLIEINSIVKAVSSIADETQMISFNASIEAARAGEHGKSFTVIAGEIRSLSEESKKTVSSIQNFTANIQNSIENTTTHSKNCMDSINLELQELNKLESFVNNIVSMLSDRKKA